MRRRGISVMLLMVVTLVPLAIVLDLALLLVSFPNALELILAIDVPIFVVVGAGAFLSFRQRRPRKKPPTASPSNVSEKMISDAINHREAQVQPETSELPESKEEAEEAGVFLEGTKIEHSARDVDQILERMKAKEMDLGVRPTTGFEPQMHQATAQALAEEPVEEIKKHPGKESKGYSLSPDKLKMPAFICRCGHPHRFLCLTCGMTVEMAVKKKNVHWVEWVPEMEGMP